MVLSRHICICGILYFKPLLVVYDVYVKIASYTSLICFDSPLLSSKIFKDTKKF
jgi:hypothetical protein